MNSKYAPLGQYLLSLSDETKDISLSFNEIERILNFHLPFSAYEYQAWWATEMNPSQPQKKIWQNAGWKIKSIDLSRQQVRFVRDRIFYERYEENHVNKDFNIPLTTQTSNFQSVSIAEKMSLVIKEPSWSLIYKIPHGTVLMKGRHGVYHSILDAASEYQFRFGCYAWTTETQVLYCGSFSADYKRGRFRNNLQGRLHNYLENHRIEETGQKNTNLMVFENLNTELLNNDVFIKTFDFKSITFDQNEIDFAAFSNDPYLVRTVEEFLIAWYRHKNQCQWNRT